MRTKKLLHRAISLLEVLAALFVVSIGLLGVLAVIPFGAFQTSKALHAEYASNMLLNATEEILIREMVKPTTWGITSLTSGGGSVVFGDVAVTITETKIGTRTRTVTVQQPDDPDGQPVPPIVTTTTTNVPSPVITSFNTRVLNCSRLLWIEPHEMIDPDHHIYCIGGTFLPPTPTAPEWSELMRGQDDLLYTTHGDKRPDFTGQRGKIQGSGKYSWFFTFLPEIQVSRSPVTPPTSEHDDWTFSQDSQTSIHIGVDFDYKIDMTTVPPIPLTSIPPFPPFPSKLMPFPWRLVLPPMYRDTEYSSCVIPTWYSGSSFSAVVSPTVDVDVLACYNRVPTDDKQVKCSFSPSLGGGTFTLPNADHLELLSQTKYVLVTWGPELEIYGGGWCKIVFLDKDESSNPRKPKVVVTGDLPDAPRNDMYVCIPSGVLYHKRLEGVPIR